MSQGDPPYRLLVAKGAERDLAKLPRKPSERIIAKIQALAHDPRPHGIEKIQGQEDLYRVRSGDFRIVYRLDDRQRVVVIETIGNRRDVYRGL